MTSCFMNIQADTQTQYVHTYVCVVCMHVCLSLFGVTMHSNIKLLNGIHNLEITIGDARSLNILEYVQYKHGSFL